MRVNYITAIDNPQTCNLRHISVCRNVILFKHEIGVFHVLERYSLYTCAIERGTEICTDGRNYSLHLYKRSRSAEGMAAFYRFFTFPDFKYMTRLKNEALVS